MDARVPERRAGPVRRLVSAQRRWLAAALLAAAAAGAAAQTPAGLKAELVPPSPAVGKPFELQLSLPDTGIGVPEPRLPALPARLALAGAPTVSQDSGLDDSGRRGRLVVVHVPLRALSAGYAELPPVDVAYGTQSYRSPALLVGVAGDDGKVPPDLAWRLRAPRVFEGQAVFVTLDLRFAPSIAFPDKVETPTVAGAGFEELSGLGQIDSETVAGRTFPRLPVATYMLTPKSKAGVVLPAVRAEWAGRSLAAPALRVEVAPLPEAAQATGAVGDLRFSAFLSRSQVAPDEQFLLTLRVEGEGNLNYLRIPEPNLGGLTLVGKAANDRISPSENGYRGYREAVYRLSGGQPGAAAIAVPAFAYVDNQGAVQTVAASTLSYAVVKGLGAGEGREAAAFQPWPFERVAAAQAQAVWRSPGAWLLLAPGPCLVAAGLARRRAWKAAFIAAATLGALAAAAALLAPRDAALADPAWRTAVESADRAFRSGDYQSAQADYRRALAAAPDNPGLLYDYALASFGKSDNAQGMFRIQRASRLRPDDADIRAAMAAYERKLGLDRQLAIAAWPAPELLFPAAGGALLLAGAALLANRRRRLGGIAAFGLFLTAGLGAVGLLAADLAQIAEPVAVISETGGAVRKIPVRAAAEWITLPGGTTVRARAHAGVFWLVETSYGVKGWLDASSLAQLPDSGPAD